MTHRILIDERETPPASADIREVEPGVYSVIHQGQSFLARAHNGRIQLHGHTFAAAIDDPRSLRQRSSSAAAQGRQTLSAAMPGKVIRILVSQGDEVLPAQPLIVVEAMKMQNEMKAAKPGRVSKIHTTEGATVTAGQPLLTVE